MLRQVALEVRSENRLQDLAKENGVKLSIVDCKAFNRTGMSLLVELRGDPQAVRKTITAVRKSPGVRQTIEGEGGGDVTPLLLVLDRLAICQASSDAAIVCLDCPLNSETQPASWRFIVRKSSDLLKILSSLEREGIGARVQGVAPLYQKPALTERQQEIIAKAVTLGYFEFPRKISLTELSRVVGVRPSTLSEILRSAERRIMENALGLPLKTRSLTRLLVAPWESLTNGTVESKSTWRRQPVCIRTRLPNWLGRLPKSTPRLAYGMGFLWKNGKRAVFQALSFITSTECY